MLKGAVVLAITYIGVIFTRLPFINIDRPAAALTGALLMVLLGVLTFQQAIAAIDFNTLALLFGMMLLIAALRRAGFFTQLAARSVAIAASPMQLMVLVIVTTAVGSAFLVNDVVVLLFTPIIVRACHMLGKNPVPYLIAEAMASNIGSVATVVGNPQNMLIGVTSGISFTRFLSYLLPVSVASTLILIAVIHLLYRREMAQPFPRNGLQADTLTVVAGHHLPAAQKRMLAWITPLLILTILGFFLSSTVGLSLPMVALIGGVAAVVFSGTKPSKLIQGVDWSLLLFFAGLFVVIGGAQHAGVLDFFLRQFRIEPDATGIFSVHLVSAAVSQVVSNVPLTMLAIPLIRQVPGHVLWISLAAGSTLGGNATLIGAVANIIVAEQAYRLGVRVGWWEFTRAGLIVAALTLAASTGILALEFRLGFLR
jgi:Na+/H+ antiporter NhaD/arsenite permease-like protein